MPAQQKDLVRAAVDRFKVRARQYAQGIAQRMGPPASATKLTDEETIRLWHFSPHADPVAAFQQLRAQGIQPAQALDQVHPYRGKLIQGASLKERIAAAERIKKMAEGEQP